MYLYNAVHIHVHIFCISANRADTVRTVSSGKTETDQSNVHAFVYVIINTKTEQVPTMPTLRVPSTTKLM